MTSFLRATNSQPIAQRYSKRLKSFMAILSSASYPCSIRPCGFRRLPIASCAERSASLNGIVEKLVTDRSRSAGQIDALSLLLRAAEGENSMTDRQLRDEVMRLLARHPVAESAH